jgi:hypothetical protein
MKKWLEFLKETPSADYEARILRAAEQELKLNRSPSGWNSRWSFVIGLSASAISAFLYFNFLKNETPNGKNKSLLALDEMLLENNFIEDLDLIADLDIMEFLEEHEGDLDI